MNEVTTRLGVYSSVGGTAFFEALLQEWESMGWEINRHHALLEEDYRSPQGRFGRLALRWRMYAGFAWTCWRCARVGNRETMRVVTTNPFFAPSLVQWAAKSNGATIQLLYDLFPDALIHAGTVQKDAWIAHRCAMITRYALRECAATVFLGRRLRTHAETCYGPAKRAAIIPVGADGIRFRGHEPAPQAFGIRPTILYCGQMGRMHEVDTILEVLLTRAARSFAWRFHAGGSGYARLRARAGGLPDVLLAEALPNEAWRETMLAAAIALVTIACGGEKVVMPSKTYSALVAGQAILAVCVRESDLADLVMEHDCGWVVEPGDSSGLAALLERLARDPDEVLAKRRNAYRAGHELYDMVPVTKQWLELFRQLEHDEAMTKRDLENPETL